MTTSRISQELVARVDGDVRLNEPLAPKISARVGGPAECFVRPRSPDGLIKLLALIRDEQLPLTLLGGGANTLVGDGGVTGVTLKLPSDLFPEQIEMTEEGGLVTLGAGASIARLIVLMKAQGLVGAEFLAGIPGTIGGACRMNAGTKMGECLSVVQEIELATPDGLGWVQKKSLKVHYRHTELPKESVVTRVRFKLARGDLSASQAMMEGDLAYRKRTQPLSLPNFGSVFKNPNGNFAGRLIEAVALKGHTIGKAQISTLHANWIVNLGGARAQDMVALMELAQKRVKDETGIELQPEVQRVGVFD